jgi:signal peptidase II
MLAGSQAVTDPGPVSRRHIYMVIVGTAAFVAAFDHLTKWLIATHLAVGQQVWPDAIVSIDRVQNTGAAFSVLPQLHWFYLAVALVVSLYILFFGYRYGTNWYRQVLIGMILGGALSNGVDRLVQGYVIDFVDVHFWPVFNVADSCIVIAIVVLLVLSFLPGQRSPQTPTSA